MTKSQLRPGLTLVSTPIGNASDISLRALDALREADVLLCEDSRVTRKLLQHHGIDVTGRRIAAYHDHSGPQDLQRIMGWLAQGLRVAVCSDAGTPLISDPGYRLVQAVLAEEIPITALPGPTAAVMALTLSGLPSDRFFYAGFLPSKSGARKKELVDLARIPATLVFYESPHRLLASLADMAEALGSRDAAVARELTKMFEEVRRGPLDELAAHYGQAGAPKGEIVVVVGPPQHVPPDEADIDAALKAAMQDNSLKDAATLIAEAHGLPRKEVYAKALALKGD